MHLLHLTSQIILLCALAAVASIAGQIHQGDPIHLDLSFTKCSPDIRKLIQENIPPELARSMDTLIDPEVYNSFIKIWTYHASGADSSQDIMHIHMTDADRLRTLQLYEREDGHWRLLSQRRDVGGSSATVASFMDVTCDSTNEIIVISPVGGSGNEWVDVLAIEHDTLALITNQLFGVDLLGRNVKFEKIGDCIDQIEIDEDGPVKYAIGRRRVFRFDPVAKTYRLASDESIK